MPFLGIKLPPKRYGMNTTQQGIVTLLRSGITGENLSLPEAFSLEEALPVLKKHSILSLAYQGAVHCGIKKDAPAMQKLLLYYYQILLQHERQALALESLFSAFEEAGIAYTPLKGCNMKKLYPKPELRPMGDADILIHLEDYPAIRSIMEKLGFSMQEDTTHVYLWKSSDLAVELHKTLVVKTEEDLYRYYGTGWQLAHHSSGNRHDLTLEDSYLFLFTHLARHYRDGGIGCRHMTDLFVWQRTYPQMDMDYIHAELKKLELLEFHQNVMDTLDVWFRNQEQTPVTRLITDFVFSSGNWGTIQNKFLHSEFKHRRNSDNIRHTTIRAVISRVFPSLQAMSYSYKTLRRHPYLLPVMWAVRWFELLTVRRKSIRRKLEALKHVDDTNLMNCEQALQIVGLYKKPST